MVHRTHERPMVHGYVCLHVLSCIHPGFQEMLPERKSPGPGILQAFASSSPGPVLEKQKMIMMFLSPFQLCNPCILQIQTCIFRQDSRGSVAAQSSRAWPHEPWLTQRWPTRTGPELSSLTLYILYPMLNARMLGSYALITQVPCDQHKISTCGQRVAVTAW
jgi:hypothetical protein